MTKSRLESAGSPRGLKRLGYRAPIVLYRVGLGFLLGQRFLMLEHRGRRTGETRRTVLEVAASRPSALYVAAAWKSSSNWLRNIAADSEVVVYSGRERFHAFARILDEDAARAVLTDYADRHPRTFARLVAFMLDDPGRTTSENVDRVASTIPVVELPRPGTGGG